MWTSLVYDGQIDWELLARMPLFDDPLMGRVHGLGPGRRVTLRAEARDEAGVDWAADATFVVSEQDFVDVRRHEPVEGSYAGVDARGLFWSMRPTTPGRERAPFVKQSLSPVSTIFSVEVDGERLVSERLERLIVGPDVQRVPVREAGLTATFFRPRKVRRRVGVVVLGGPEGGVPELPAAQLASHGYPSLAVGYFGLEGLPDQLVEIPLESLAHAAAWLRGQANVDPERVVAFGGSKGGEAALVLAALVPGFAGVVAYSPSGVVWQGLDLKLKRSSWTFQGEPLPFVPYRIPAARLGELIWKGVRKQPVAFRPIYEASLQDAVALERATIPVERISAPILLISTSDDQVWPSKALGEIAMRRRAAHGLAYADEHLSFDGAGHLVELPGAPTVNADVSGGMIFGGTPAGRARAQAEAWDAVLRFLGRL